MSSIFKPNSYKVMLNESAQFQSQCTAQILMPHGIFVAWVLSALLAAAVSYIGSCYGAVVRRFDSKTGGGVLYWYFLFLKLLFAFVCSSALLFFISMNLF